jgi:hypothetical protein
MDRETEVMLSLNELQRLLVPVSTQQVVEKKGPRRYAGGSVFHLRNQGQLLHGPGGCRVVWAGFSWSNFMT